MLNKKRVAWWELIAPDYEREAQLKQDRKEVSYEMVYQDWLDGKSYRQISTDHNMHKSTVWRVIRDRR